MDINENDIEEKELKKRFEEDFGRERRELENSYDFLSEKIKLTRKRLVDIANPDSDRDPAMMKFEKRVIKAHEQELLREQAEVRLRQEEQAERERKAWFYCRMWIINRRIETP